MAYKTPAIHKLVKLRITKHEAGPSLYIEVIVVYGCNIFESLNDFKEKCRKEIEKLTTMSISHFDIVARGIEVPKKEEK